jgi:hypothetical protein
MKGVLGVKASIIRHSMVQRVSSNLYYGTVSWNKHYILSDSKYIGY